MCIAIFFLSNTTCNTNIANRDETINTAKAPILSTFTFGTKEIAGAQENHNGWILDIKIGQVEGEITKNHAQMSICLNNFDFIHNLTILKW